MKKSTLILNIAWISTILLSTLSIQSMKRICTQSPSQSSFIKIVSQGSQISADKKKQHSDNEYSLISLPDEILTTIFAQCISKDYEFGLALSNTVKIFMKLSTMCKRFNRWLTCEAIGNFCKHYYQFTKDCLLSSLSYFNFGKEDRIPILILIHAGAKHKQGSSLIDHAALYNDAHMLKLLFKYEVEKERTRSAPDYFFAYTAAIAQIFIDNGIKMYKSKYFENNYISRDDLY